MPRKIRRKDVEWERASCLGLDTELFYEHRTGLLEQGLSFDHLRRICMDCPIQKECLQVAVAHEPYGFWGGLSDEERNHMYAGKKTRTIEALKRDLKWLGLDFDSIVKEVQSIERDFMYNRGHITINPLKEEL
jgi:WhiB family redox-sensing transcriptional regulator